MIKKVNFSQNNLQKFSKILGALKEACYPSFEQIQPIIQSNSPRDCLYSDHGIYSMKELDDCVQKKQILPPHISVIKINGTTWFSADDNPLDFYSTKNYVTLGFSPQRLINPKILKDKSIFNCVKKMLAILGQKKSSATDAIKAFPEDICRKVYELSSPREYILSNLMHSIEQVRSTLFQHLKSHHENDIRKLPEFKTFQNPNSSDIVLNFLKNNYLGFSLAEKWGYIKNSQQLITFQKLRNTPRHPSKFMPSPLDSEEILENMSEEDWNRWIYHAGYPYQSPSKLYDDFQKALFFVKPKTAHDTVSYDDATCSIWAQKDIDQFKNILKALPYRNKLETFLAKNFPEEVSSQTVTIEKSDKTHVSEPVIAFSSFYIKKWSIAPSTAAQKQPDGSILFKEEDFRNWGRISNTCAHANEGFQKSAKILSEDMQALSDFVNDLTDAFNRKRRSQMQVHKNVQRPAQRSER